MVFSITQQPYFYQTRPFVAAMVVLGGSLVGGIYRLRVRQISRAMSARFDERLDERMRVARDLHDTFLQTVQGSRLGGRRCPEGHRGSRPHGAGDGAIVGVAGAGH